MSRYILLPTDQKGETKSTYILVPIEGIGEGNEIKVQQHNNLNTFDDVYQDVTDKEKFRTFAIKLCKSNIYVNKDGFLADRETVLRDVNIEFAILDFCNGLYSHAYEKFYTFLSKHGII